MYIRSIEWIDKSAREACVCVTDGNLCISAFSQPLIHSVGEEIVEPLECISVEDICLSDKKIFRIEESDSSFSYRIIGTISDVDNSIINVGRLTLHIKKDLLPKDLIKDDYIIFSVGRIDIW